MPKKYRFHFETKKKRTKKKTTAKKKKTIKEKKKKVRTLGRKIMFQIMKRKIRHKRITKRKKGRTVKRLKQHGTSNLKLDRKRKALAPGRRISRYGNKYTETRRNRSDKKGKKV